MMRDDVANYLTDMKCSINAVYDEPCQVFAMQPGRPDFYGQVIYSLQYVASFPTVSDALRYAEAKNLRNFHVTPDDGAE